MKEFWKSITQLFKTEYHDHTIYEFDGDMSVIGDEDFQGIASECPYCTDADPATGLFSVDQNIGVYDVPTEYKLPDETIPS